MKRKLDKGRPQGRGDVTTRTWAQEDAMRKQKKFKQRVKFTSGTDRPKDEQAKERMAEALAAYQGPITKCSPESAQKRRLSAWANVAKQWTRPK
jgi:hypothetical protein